LALILLESLYENVAHFFTLPTVGWNEDWMLAHFVKVLPRWTRKPREPAISKMKSIFSSAAEEEALKKKTADEHGRYALMRWNKTKVIIASLANDQTVGQHWLDAFKKLKNASAYDHPTALAHGDIAAQQRSIQLQEAQEYLQQHPPSDNSRAPLSQRPPVSSASSSRSASV
jgi:hypothetical protein